MFHGLFFASVDEPQSIAFSAISEYCELFNHRTQSTIVRQLHSNKNSSSVSLGHYGTKSAFCSHVSTCEGSECECHKIVADFLASTKSANRYSLSNAAFLRTRIQFPILFIFADENRHVAVSSYGDNDIGRRNIDPGFYSIRYFHITVVDDMIVGLKWLLKPTNNQ